MDAYRIRPGWLFWLICALTAPITIGVAPIALLLLIPKWPRAVDKDGFLMRNGQRIPWSERTNVMKFPFGRYEFIFGGTTVQFPTRYIADGKKIHAAICKHIGVSWKSG